MAEARGPLSRAEAVRYVGVDETPLRLSDALRAALERAEKAEAEVAELDGYAEAAQESLKQRDAALEKLRVAEEALGGAEDAQCGCSFEADAERGYPKRECEAHGLIQKTLTAIRADARPTREEPSAFSQKVKIITVVSESMGWDQGKAMVWYTTPNPNLGGATPEEMVNVGRGHKVLQFVANAIDENGPPRSQS